MARAASFPRRRREEVLRAAAELFHEKGYAATSTADLAARLGMLRGSVYYYFDTKEGLLFELIHDVYARVLASLEEVVGGGGDAVARLRRFVENSVVQFATDRVAGALVLNESHSLSAEHRALVRRDAETYERVLLDLLREGQREGLVRPDVDVRIVAMAVLGAGNWLHRWYREGDDVTPHELGRQFADTFLDGLVPRPG